MGGHQAVNIINRRELQAAEDEAAVRAELVADYQTTFEHPYIAAAKGYVDDVIDPRETRRRIAAALRMLQRQGRVAAGEEARKHPAVATPRLARGAQLKEPARWRKSP